MISVIVLTYNQEKTIGRTLDSILAQQCHEKVVIMLSDDASTDGTPEICRQYAERFPEKIRLTLNKKNKGLIDNYYDTLLECEGDLIADCAGDDYWCDTLKLEKELCVMEQHPEVTLVHTDWVCRLASSGELQMPPPPSFTDFITDGTTMLESIITQMKRPVVHLCTALYRKSVFMKEYEKHRDLFRNKEYCCEDLQLVFAMALNGAIAYLPDVTLHYTVEEGTISNTGDYGRQFNFVRRVSELSYALSDTFQVKSQRINDYLAFRVYELLMHSFRTCSKQNRASALACQQRWGAKDTKKTRLLKLITSNSITWRMALAIRKFVLLLK